MMSKLRKIIAAALTVSCLALCAVPAAFADEEAIATATDDTNTHSGEFISEYVNEIVEFLAVFAKDGVTSNSLYKAALTDVLKAHPELYEQVMTAMLSSIDDYSVFYPGSQEYDEFISQLEGVVGGIGITMNEVGGKLVVGSVYNESPAAKAGILPGDVLYSADGVSLFGADITAAQQLIRGEIGTTVVIGVIRDGSENPLFYTITREEIAERLSVSYNLIEGKDDIDSSPRKAMYIRIYSFMDNAAEQFAEAMQVVNENEITDLIIDVRDNGGGYLSEAVEIAGNFVPNGKPIVTEDHKADMFDVTYTSSNTSDKKYDLVVLVNENTASASEILAAAVQENEAGILIGTTTYGKGTVQNTMPLKDGEAMKYTSAYYLTPTGRNIDQVGIVPDSAVENTFVPFDHSGYSDFDYAAVYESGMSDPNVAKAKKIFAVWGLYTGNIDDPYFDDELAAAITYFQANRGLFPYGVLDLTTQREVYKALLETRQEIDDQLDAAMRHFGIAPNE